MPPVIAAARVGDDVAEEVVGDDHVESRGSVVMKIIAASMCM